MIALDAGARVLCQTAAKGDRSFRSAWQAKVSETPEAAVTRVADDLGLRLSQWQRQNHARQVAGWWKNYRLRPGEDATDVLASLAEEALVSRVEPLPCSYQDVLAELGMQDDKPADQPVHPPARLVNCGPGFGNPAWAAWGPVLSPRDRVPRPGPHNRHAFPPPCRKERQTCSTSKPAPRPSS